MCVRGGVADEHEEIICSKDIAKPIFEETEESLSSVEQQRSEGSSSTNGVSDKDITGDDLIKSLVNMYAALASKGNDSKARPSAFHAPRTPVISQREYLTRLMTYFKCSDACLITSMVFIHRLVEFHPEFKPNDRCFHRLFAACLVVSAKFHDDVYYSNTYYAKVCGLTVGELNHLETTLVKMLDWNLRVKTEEYAEYQSRVRGVFRRTPKNEPVHL